MVGTAVLVSSTGRLVGDASGVIEANNVGVAGGAGGAVAAWVSKVGGSSKDSVSGAVLA